MPRGISNSWRSLALSDWPGRKTHRGLNSLQPGQTPPGRHSPVSWFMVDAGLPVPDPLSNNPWLHPANFLLDGRRGLPSLPLEAAPTACKLFYSPSPCILSILFSTPSPSLLAQRDLWLHDSFHSLSRLVRSLRRRLDLLTSTLFDRLLVFTPSNPPYRIVRC
jgi:hypothetical protein